MHDDVGAVLGQRLGLADPVDTDDQGEPPGATGLHAGQGVFVDDGALGADAQVAGGGDEGVGRRAPVQA